MTTADLITDSTAVQPIYDAFFHHLSEIDTLPSDPADAARLAERLQALRVEPIHGVTAVPVHIDLTQHTLPFHGLSITAEAVTLRDLSGQDYTLACAPDCWQEGVFPASDERCIVSGGWTTPEHFELLAELCGDFAVCMKLFVQLKDGRASVRVVSSLWEFQAGWSGQDWGSVLP